MFPRLIWNADTHLKIFHDVILAGLPGQPNDDQIVSLVGVIVVLILIIHLAHGWKVVRWPGTTNHILYISRLVGWAGDTLIFFEYISMSLSVFLFSLGSSLLVSCWNEKLEDALKNNSKNAAKKIQFHRGQVVPEAGRRCRSSHPNLLQWEDKAPWHDSQHLGEPRYKKNG